MSKIRFTVGDSPIWHEIQMEGYQLSGELVQDVQHLSYIITQEQKRLQCGKAKKIEVLDDFGNLQACSSDIVDYNKWEYRQSEK